MTLTKEDILEFIANTSPDFSKTESMGVTMYKMFTVPTQHITDENLENLIIRGVEAYKKYGNKSALSYMLENLPIAPTPKGFKFDKKNPQEYVAKVLYEQFSNLLKTASGDNERNL